MARSSRFEGIVELALDEPRLFRLGPASTWRFVQIAHAVVNFGGPAETLRFGALELFGSIDDLAHWLRIDRADLEGDLAWLQAAGLLDGFPDAIRLGAPFALSPRAQASRSNGMRGGRPRLVSAREV